MTEATLYDRLGGVFAIAAVVNRFSDAIFDDPIAGRTSKNPALRKWQRPIGSLVAAGTSAPQASECTSARSET